MSFSQSSYEVMEDDDTVTLTLQLSQMSSVPFEVTVNTMDVTAVGKEVVINSEVSLTYVSCTIDGEDYSGGHMTINVPADVMTEAFTVAIVDDNIVECVETFTVTISSVTTCGATIGSHSSTEVRITDDDSK